MKRLVFGAWILTGMAACDQPTRPDAPSLSRGTGHAMGCLIARCASRAEAVQAWQGASRLRLVR